MAEAYLVLYDEPDGGVRLGRDYCGEYDDSSHAHRMARAVQAMMDKMGSRLPEPESTPLQLQEGNAIDSGLAEPVVRS